MAQVLSGLIFNLKERNTPQKAGYHMVYLNSVSVIALCSLVGVIALGFLSVLRQRKPPELPDVVTMYFSVWADLQGITLCVISTQSKSLATLGELQPYVFLAGLIVVW